MFYSNLQIDCETGLGLSTGQGSDPQLQISWSKDGGHSFTVARWTSLGKQGEFNFRAMLRGVIGRARNMVFDIVCSEPIPLRMNQAFVQVDKGTW